MTRKTHLVRFVGAAAVLLFAWDAKADLVASWSCYVPSSRIDCAVIKSSLTSRIPFLRMTNEVDQADVAITLGTVPTDGGIRFKFDLVGRVLDGYRTEVHTTDKVPSNVDQAATMVRVLTKIERAQPVSDPYADPRQEIEASMRAAVQRGFTSPLSIRSGVSIRYVFGNGSLNSEDQRWKYATNLR